MGVQVEHEGARVGVTVREAKGKQRRVGSS